MPTYIALCNFTDQGVRNVKDTIGRAEAAQAAAANFGASMTNIVWTLGHYDLVATLDAPDDESATAFALAVASKGNVRMQTLRAFTKDELGGILDRLG